MKLFKVWILPFIIISNILIILLIFEFYTECANNRLFWRVDNFVQSFMFSVTVFAPPCIFISLVVKIITIICYINFAEFVIG